MHRNAKAGASAPIAGVVGLALLGRLIVEGRWLLPAPVGDSDYFLTASANYCRTGFLGTTAFPIDPTGRARMVWHGFVSPMLYGLADPSCSARGYYVILGLIQLMTVLAVMVLARYLRSSAPTTCALAVFALAAQSVLLFRPETLGLLWIVLTELAFEHGLTVLAGALLGALVCTQPTLAGLYGLFLLCVRFSWLRGHGYRLAFAALVTCALLLLCYPFPIKDLVHGILLQAKLIRDRSDGSWLSYYVLLPFLPFWGGLFIAAWAVASLRHRLLIALAPVFWYFGPRLPPICYNLIPVCWLLLRQASTTAPRRINLALSVSTLILAVSGLAAMTARDLLTAAHYGDTFATTRDTVRALTATHRFAGPLPAFLTLTNPELHVTDPRSNPVQRHAPADTVRLFAVSGHPQSPCPDAAAFPVSLSLGRWTLFRSNSGWRVYVCQAESPDH